MQEIRVYHSGLTWPKYSRKYQSNNNWTRSDALRRNTIKRRETTVSTEHPHLTALKLIAVGTYCAVYELGCWPPCMEHVYRCQFSHSICSLHVSVIFFVTLTKLQTFSLLLHLLWWSVIRDLWCYYCNCFRVPGIVPT